LVSFFCTNSDALSLKEAYTYALEHNPTLEVKEYSIAIAQKNESSSHSFYKPKFELNMDFRKIASDQAEIGMGLNPEYQGSVGATASQELFNLDSNTQIDTAKISKTIAKLDKSNTMMEIALQIGNEFISIAYYQVIQKIYETKKKRIQGYLNIAQERYKAGIMDTGDIYRLQSELSQIHSDIESVQNSIHLKNISLKNIIAMPQDVNITTKLTEKELEEFANLSNKTEEENPSITIKRQEIEQDKIVSKNIASSYYLPSLTLYGSLDHTIWRDGLGTQMAPFLNHDVIYTQYRVGFLAKVPLYIGGIKQTQRETLAIQQLQNTSTITELQNQLKKEQLSAIDSIKSAQKSYLLNKKSSLDAQKYLDVIEKQYRAGVVDILHILDAQEFATLASLKQEKNKFQILKYKLALAYSLNKLKKPFANEDLQ